MLEGKLTLPALYALNTTKDAWAEQIAFKVKEGTATPDEIVCLIEFTKDNGGIEYACRTIEQYKKKAFDLLAALPDSNICLALRTYLDYVVAREK
jgi:octaprenyl-diphosphate synthase